METSEDLAVVFLSKDKDKQVSKPVEVEDDDEEQATNFVFREAVHSRWLLVRHCSFQALSLSVVRQVQSRRHAVHQPRS